MPAAQHLFVFDLFKHQTQLRKDVTLAFNRAVEAGSTQNKAGSPGLEIPIPDLEILVPDLGSNFFCCC